MARFVIDLGDIEMSKKAQYALNQDLQKTALGHVAQIDIKQPFALRFPEWLGLILRRDFDTLVKAENLVGEQLANIPLGFSK